MISLSYKNVNGSLFKKSQASINSPSTPLLRVFLLYLQVPDGMIITPNPNPNPPRDGVTKSLTPPCDAV